MPKTTLHSLLIFSSACMIVSCQKAAVEKTSTLAQSATAPAKNSSSDQDLKTNTFYGPQVAMGNGKARTYVIISHSNAPSEIGIEMTKEALTGLPDGHDEVSFELPLHQKAKAVTPFDHVEIDWNPAGHPPGPYLAPHFDFHFYKITASEQAAIVPGPEMELLPPAGAMPPIYVPTPGGVPQMGKHWVDVSSPELNGQAFTKTFIYGSYNGKVIFNEPMITLATLMSGQASTTPIPQPQVFMPAGTYYPSAYSISADARSHYVSLSNFVFRP